MANRLNELRKEKGLTLRELADTLRLDYSTLGHIERGRRDFSISSLRRACDYFHVSADYISAGQTADPMERCEARR